MAKVIVALTMSLDGFIAGADDGPEQGLGDGGMRLFDWYFDGDTPIRHYQAAADRGVPVPPFRLKKPSVAVFEELIDNGGAVVTGRRTYDITNGWVGNGPLPGLPLFVVTHHIPDQVPRGETCGPDCSTRSRSTWCRCCSDPGCGCLTASGPTTSSWTSSRSSTHRA